MMLIVVLNSLVTYLYEKIVMWYITLWWRKKVEKKKEIKQQRIVNTDIRMAEAGGATGRHSYRQSLLKKYNSQLDFEGLR